MEQEQQDSLKEPETRTPGVDGWEPPKDGTWVPKTRMDESVNTHKDRATELETRAMTAEAEAKAEREARIRLEERLTAGETKKGESKEVTRAQLQQEVEAGRLTQSMADDAWIAQHKETWKADMRQEASQQREEDQQNRLIDEQFAAYTRACPEIQVDGSKERKNIVREFNELVRMGQPNTISTQLIATKTILGPIDKLTELRSKREAHSETSTGASEGDRPASRSLSERGARQKAYIEKLVERGMITKEDAEKDLKYVSGS